MLPKYYIVHDGHGSHFDTTYYNILGAQCHVMISAQQVQYDTTSRELNHTAQQRKRQPVSIQYHNAVKYVITLRTL